MVTNLTAAGVNIKAKPNGDDCQIVVEADKSSINQYRAGQEFNSFNDHRTAMSMIVFCSALPKQSQINDRECINKSFPGFIHTRELLNKKI
jgi:5-enolpyruvylshikimate-3-phosphate synthase